MSDSIFKRMAIIVKTYVDNTKNLLQTEINKKLDSETVTSLSLVNNDLVYTDEKNVTTHIDLSKYLDEDARAIATGTLDSVTGIVTFTRDDNTTFTLNLSALLDDTNLVTSVAGKTGVVTLTKNDVGLNNVDNTSDLNKPISTATLSALNLKSDTTHNHSGVYEPADATILKNSKIGVTVQGYNANTVIDASYVHTDNNYTTAEKTKLSAIQATTISTVSGSTTQTIRSYSYTTFRTAKLVIQIVDATNGETQVQESLVTTDGTTAYIVNYGVMTTGATELATLSATYSASTVNVQLTNSTTHTLNVKVSTTLIET